MRILVTGAMGFVGVNLVRELARSASTTILAADLHPPDDRIRHFWSPAQARIEPIRLDVTHSQDLIDLAVQQEISHILHCAAITPSPEEERTRPDHVSTVNLMGALHALEAARRARSVERLLLMSSSGVYGVPTVSRAGHGETRDMDAPINEEDPLVLDNLYAITKRSTELLAARYCMLSGKQIASIRLGPFYGSLERPSPSRPHVSIPGRLFAALQAKQAVTVAGADISRDWIYAGDVAAAVKALFVAPRLRHSVYNLGAGRPISMREMVDAFVRQGLDATWVSDHERADIRMERRQGRQTMSIRRISSDTCWVPTADPHDHVREMVSSALLA